MSENTELHVSPSEIVKMSGMSMHNTKKLVLNLIEPKFKSGNFKFYLRSEVEEFLDLHAPILSLFKVPAKAEDSVETTQDETVQNEG